jgi:hypothetical protein
MANKALNNSQSTHTKDKSTIFNFPLSKPGRNQLEELASIWGVSLASAIRRSIDNALTIARVNTKTANDTEQSMQSKVAMLEALLSLHKELSVIRTNTEKIIVATVVAKDGTNQ